MNKKEKVRITVLLDPARVAALRTEAAKKGVSIPTLCTMMLTQAADEFKGGVK